MVSSITPTPPVSAVRGVATPPTGAGLQAGAVLSAKVQELVGDNLVQVAIGNLTMELGSDVPLQVGQSVQVAVALTDNGLRVGLIGQGSGSATTSGPTTATVVDVGTATLPAVAPQPDPLTPVERLAVSVATREAAIQQSGQGQLFADLNAVANSPSLPPALRAAIAQVLVQQTPLDTELTGEDIRNAFQNSGLLLETSLATATAASAGSSPDLKAALIVLRQALTSVLPIADETAGSTAQPATSPYVAPASQSKPAAASQMLPSPSLVPDGNEPAGPQQAAPQTSPPPQTTSPPARGQQPSPTFVADGNEAGMPQQVVPKTTPPPASELQSSPSLILDSDEPVASPQPMAVQTGSLRPDGLVMADAADVAISEAFAQAKPQSLTPGTALALLQEVQQQVPRVAGYLLPRVSNQNGRGNNVVRSNTPPPPFRGGLPSPQMIATPSLAPDASLSRIAHRLLDETDGALARQTLLQVASLPDRTDATGNRIDPSLPRWNFEIPFVTPQGTAMAQFEISRDGGGNDASEAAKRVWRARFSLDVEPAGPVHALISFTSERTSVRMWAERPATAAQLRAGISDLNQALSRAELAPGDIVVQEGTPPAVAPPRAGHFLDRAL